MILAEAAPRLLDSIERSRRFVLTGHVNIDGDSLGSMLAMTHWLRARGKEVLPLCFEPVLERYAFLTRESGIEVFDRDSHAARVHAAECFMMFDFSAVTRMPGLWPLVAESKATKVCVDHHPCANPPGDLNVHDPSAPATGSIVLGLLRHFRARIDARIAEALLVAIGTDCGWFRYRNTSPQVLRDVAELLGAGVDASQVYREVYQRNDVSLIRLFGRVAAAVREDVGGRLLWATIPLPLAQELGVGPYETDELLDLLRTARDADLIALFREMRDGKIRLNLRSSGPVDVGRIAQRLGGGGHAHAAGATLDGALDAESDRVVEILRGALAQPSLVP